jgi:hypothetical protein
VPQKVPTLGPYIKRKSNYNSTLSHVQMPGQTVGKWPLLTQLPITTSDFTESLPMKTVISVLFNQYSNSA